MSRGVLLFAFNRPTTDYAKMAAITAKRVKHFLNLPVTLVTNEYVESDDIENVILVEADTSNSRDNKVWNNKGRHNAYDLTPYNETLVLDVDYVVNSNMLLKCFDIYDDFLTFNKTSVMMQPEKPQEYVGLNPMYSLPCLWATVIVFKKTAKVKQIFDCMKMVQDHYDYYSQLYMFLPIPYRNDYALTIAVRIVNGHLNDSSNFIPWNLVHVNPEFKVKRINDTPMNTEYVISGRRWHKGKSKAEHIIVKDMDFHMISKENFLEVAHD